VESFPIKKQFDCSLLPSKWRLAVSFLSLNMTSSQELAFSPELTSSQEVTLLLEEISSPEMMSSQK
jgi:hypothetical protein